MISNKKSSFVQVVLQRTLER